MRIRSIKPEFWSSPTVARLGLGARLTFIGLWSYCDDHGRGRDDPRLIRAAVWPLDDAIGYPQVGDWVEEIAAAGLIVRYFAGVPTLAVCSWREHQRVSHPSASRFGSPPEDLLSIAEGLRHPPETLGSPRSARAHVRAGAGSREQGAGSDGAGSREREQGTMEKGAGRSAAPVDQDPEPEPEPELGSEEAQEESDRYAQWAERYELDVHQTALLDKVLSAHPGWMQGAGALTPAGVRKLAEQHGGIRVSEALEELALRVQNGGVDDVERPYAYFAGMIEGELL